MKKMLFVVMGAVAILVVVGGGLYFVGTKQAQAPEAPAYTIPPEELRNPDEIVVEGNRFTDTRQGYSGIIPEGWEIRKPDRIDRGVDLYDQKFLTTGEGCKISSGFISTVDTAEDLIKQAEEDLVSQTVNNFEVRDVTINDKLGKHAILDSVETGYSEAVYLDTARGLFEAVVFGRNACAEQFNIFFDSLRI